MKNNIEYETLVEGLRKVPTFEIAEAIARKDFPLKLPERKWLTIFNSSEISQFRGNSIRYGCYGDEPQQS